MRIVFDKTDVDRRRFGVTTLSHSTVAASRTCSDSLRDRSRSEHPIAAGVVALHEKRGVSYPPPGDGCCDPRKGARGVVDGANVAVVILGSSRNNTSPRMMSA